MLRSIIYFGPKLSYFEKVWATVFAFRSSTVIGNGPLNPACAYIHFCSGLRECRWPGRCHVERRDGVTFYLDSAHTPLSMKVTIAMEKRLLVLYSIQSDLDD